MSDLSPAGFPGEPQEKRPWVVVLLAFLIFVAAFVQLATVVVAVIFMFRPGEAQQLFGQSVSDWYWLMTAILTFILALIYIWMGRGMLAGDPQAWMLLNILAIINIIFAIFQIPFGTGWAELLLNIIILAFNNMADTRRWFNLGA